jgi:glyoxylase-like metal-dependent hydrolase (beta-lactamase superfamily II)
MNKWTIGAGAAVLVVLLAAGAAWVFRFDVFLLMVGPGDSPALMGQSQIELGDGVEWFDDYYTVQQVGDGVFAIGEPRYFQKNYNYLIVGTERAVLFDSGPGVRNIAAVVASLTELPVTVAASHLHYDHIGGHGAFESLAALDIEAMRAREKEGVFAPSDNQFLGRLEGIETPTLKVTEWWAPGETVDLGERSLTVFYTPGHTATSMMLYDADAGFALTGDFIYPGDLFAFLPDSDLVEYEAAASRLLQSIPEAVRLFAAHGVDGEGYFAPELGMSDLQDLEAALIGIRDGEIEGVGFYPRGFPVNDHINILTPG